MHPQGAGAGPKKRQGAVSSITDDEIREKYLERAIRELNDWAGTWPRARTARAAT